MRFLKIFMLVSGLAFGALAWDVRQSLLQPWTLRGPELVAVVPGKNIKDVIDTIDKSGFIDSHRAGLYAWLYLRVWSRGNTLRAGEYQVKPGLNTLDFIKLVTSGKIFFHELTVIEGWRFADALVEIQNEPAIRKTLKSAKPDAVMKALGSEETPAEGSLLPETYRFPKGTTDLSMLRQAHAAMKNVLSQEWERRSEGLPYQTPLEALTMASIIEKETGSAMERAKISGVFVRRLLNKMKLQTDPTVIYGLGERFDGNLRRRDLRRDTPYNTYTRYGLPPTPICLPGRAAIHAAMHPESGDAVYFVSKGDGTHVFSDSLDQHNAAVRQYQIKPAQKRKK